MASSKASPTEAAKKADVRRSRSTWTVSTTTPLTPWFGGEEGSVVVRNTFVECVFPPPPGATTRSKSTPPRIEGPRSAVHQKSVPGAKKGASAGEQAKGTPIGDSRRPAQAVAHSGGGRHGARWWEESTEVCAISGFPIRFLPYPPFRLKVPGGEVYVDGQYLAAKMIAETNFEANGTVLTKANLDALDAYLARCKLPKALRTAEAKKEHKAGLEGNGWAERSWQARRGFAKAKLRSLKEIQAARSAKIRRTSGSSWAEAKRCEGVVADPPMMAPVIPVAPPRVVHQRAVFVVPVQMPLIMSGDCPANVSRCCLFFG